MNKVRLTSIDSVEWENPDGTKGRWITVTTLVENEKYTCTASGLPETEVRLTSVYVLPASNYSAESIPQGGGRTTVIGECCIKWEFTKVTN